MNLNFNEFLRVMTAILIVLLIVQGLDYIFGFGVNNYVFIVFCIVFAFTIGAVYHNMLLDKEEKVMKNSKKTVDENLRQKLNDMQDEINESYEQEGLTDEVLDKQIELNAMRHELDVTDERKIVNKDGFAQ